MSFTGLKDGDSVIKAAGITNFITSGDGTITFGGTEYKFTDVGNNGGIFLLESNKVTDFVFRDAGDAFIVQKVALSFSPISMLKTSLRGRACHS